MKTRTFCKLFFENQIQWVSENYIPVRVLAGMSKSLYPLNTGWQEIIIEYSFCSTNLTWLF
jgi:hypothetical protein